MAAYAALNSVMHIIHDIQHHPSPPISIDFQQLHSLSQILTSLQEFLESYKSPVADADDEADPMEMRIADAAYAAEDVIESHIVDMIHLPRTNQQISCFSNCFLAPKKPENEDDEQTKSINFYQDLQRVIAEMDLVKQMAMQLDTEKAVAVYDHNVSSSAAPFRSFSSSSAMVCSDAVLLGIMEKLTEDRPDRQVIPIVGMGGIGKTTLAKHVYEHQLIKEHFHVCAWITISQQYNTREIVREVLSQLTNKKKEKLNEMSEDELGSELYKYLSGTRFLIVMDDMWGIDAWENIQHFFPNNGNGSRILVTTRQSQLGSQLNTNYRLQMEFLDEVSSWDLFTKTVFGERNGCPHELEKIGKKIVGSCRGLPLSIVVVGGILKRMEHTQRCWEPIRNNLTSIVNLENDKHCLRLLKLSYNHLPVYLKSCFLYMGVFEEDDRIRVSTLINLWVSEGLLKPVNDRTMEAIAMDCLKDLIDRNLILIDELGSTGNVKTCKIHDLLRDLCLNEGQRNRFHHVIGRYSPQGINSQCRRIVIHKNTSKKKVLKELKSFPHARSVIFYYEKGPRCKNFGLLRTLHAFKSGSYKVNSVATQCVNLRHLAVEVGSRSSFFSSFHLFWNLHTLIVFCRNKSNFPAEIWNMPQFKHIQIMISYWCLPDPPSDEDDDVVIMENLHILKGVKNLKCCEEVVKRIPNIKKLTIYYYGQLKGTKHDDSYCVSNIKSLCKLESLFVYCYDSKYKDAPYLHKLSFPHSLKSLTLQMFCEFEWEAVLEKIGSLPHLEKLKLMFGRFRTGEWEIVEGQFSNLKYLELYRCYDLKQWKVEGSSVLPRLEKLKLIRLPKLEEIPCEIGHIPTLQKVELRGCRESAVKSAKEMVEEQVELQGDQLPFHVHVKLDGEKNEALLDLADHNFTVHIKKLEIYYDGQLKGTKHDDFYCVSNIKSLCKLESLFVYCYDPKYRDAPYLHKLSFPHSLKSLTLQMENKLEWEEVLEKIGSLPHLEKLKLWGGWFRTGEWEIVEGQFSNLKYLELFWCDDLKQWKVEGSSVLPRLEQLRLSFLKELEEIPCEIGHIPTLQNVWLFACSESVVKSAKEMVEEQVELQGEPLPFRVHVHYWGKKNEALLGSADHNFTVHYD